MKTWQVWEILRKFKDACRLRGWKTSESEDWVQAGEKYHNFLLTRNIHPSSFKTIVANRKCVIREGLSYRVVEAQYVAWVFSETPSENLVNVLLENPSFTGKVAIYDLSSFTKGKKVCVKLNYTDSPVFKEFESFLEREFKAEIKQHANLKPNIKDCALTETP